MQILPIQIREKDGKTKCSIYHIPLRGKRHPHLRKRKWNCINALLAKYICPLKKSRKSVKRFANITERAIRFNRRCSVKRLIEWVCCPMCGSKTRIKIQSDTELTNFPLYCPKCKREALIKATAENATL